MSTWRPLVRILAVDAGRLRCPQRGPIAEAECTTCPYRCVGEEIPASVACSYPIPAAETFLARARTRDDVRLALGQLVEQS